MFICLRFFYNSVSREIHRTNFYKNTTYCISFIYGFNLYTTNTAFNKYNIIHFYSCNCWCSLWIMNWMACCAVKTLIKWPLVKLLQSIKSCKIYILYDTTSTIIEANSLQTAWIFWVCSWSVHMSIIIFFRQKGGISVLSAECHPKHWNQHQCAVIS